MEGATDYSLFLDDLLDESEFSGENPADSPSDSIFHMEVDNALSTSDESETIIMTDTKRSDAAIIAKTTAMEVAYNKIRHIKEADPLRLPRDILNEAEEAEDMDSGFKQCIKITQDMILDIMNVISSTPSEGPIGENTAEKTVKLAHAVRDFFVNIQSQYHDELSRIVEIEKHLPTINDQIEEKFLFNLLKHLAEKIIPNTNNSAVAEHAILASFSALYDRGVYKPYLHLVQTYPLLPQPLRDILEYVYHLIEKTLEDYTEITGYKMYWKAQMNSVVARMRNSPKLLKERLEFKNLMEGLAEDATLKQKPEFSMAPAKGPKALSTFEEGIAVREGIVARVGPMGERLKKGDLGYQKENIGFRKYGGGGGGSPDV